MTDSVKLEIYSTSTSDESVKYSVGYINPNATDAKLSTFARQLNNLSTNTFSSVTKIISRDITLAN